MQDFSERRVCFTASSKPVLHVPLYVSVSISYSSHRLCGATAQRVRFCILEFFIFLVVVVVGVGLISFVPQGLSGMGWLHTVNVHAQHAHDCNRFSSIPLTTKKGMQKKKGKACKHFYIQLASKTQGCHV